MYNIQHTSVPNGKDIIITLDCIRPDMNIRYTTDGTTPNPKSLVYTSPITLSKNTVLKASTFDEDKMMGKVLELPIIWYKATGKQIIGMNNNEKDLQTE